MKASTRWTVWTAAGDLTEGLFGHIVLYILEVLPYLDRRGIEPTWQLRSRLYGQAPDYTVVPGVFDVARPAAAAGDGLPVRKNLMLLRALHGVTLGDDWQYAHHLWTKYFRIPPRVEAAADGVTLGSRALGLHYRGTDKSTASWDTNPVSQNDFLTLVDDHLLGHPQIDTLFIATDEASFIENAKARYSKLRVLSTGAGSFHKSNAGEVVTSMKGDHAVLDCVLLSRCAQVLNCSSALSAFAKVLNPDLQIHRVAASKLFDVVPYFPIAYIPRLETTDPVCRDILERQFKDDWVDHPRARRRPFRVRRVALPSRLYRMYRFSRTGLKQQLILRGLIRESARTYI